MSEAGLLPSPPWIRRWKQDVGEYHRMAAAGILTHDDQVELIEGEIIEMSPTGPLHAALSRRLDRVLGRLVGERALVSVGMPVRLGEHSEPQPDIALLRPRADDYALRHPMPTDVLLLIELAESSLRFDRAIKLPLYGTHGIREYWIFDLAGRTADICRQPQAGGYASVARLGPDAEIEPEALPGVRLRLSEILG